MSEDIDNNEAALGNDDITPTDDAPQLTEVEALASEMGWKPEAQYSGSAPWKPARDFIKTEREISRDMRKQVRTLSETVERMAAAGTKQTQRALERQAEELNRAFEQAVENKDTKAAAEAAKGMRELEQEARSSAGFDPADTERRFAADNPWYGKDDEATAYAITISQRLAGQGKSVAEQLEAASTGVRKRFPELFADAPPPNPRKDPPSLHSPSAARGKPKEKGFADLPADAKAAAESHAKLAASRFGANPEEIKATYAADYFSARA